jgi:hypothetical protein
MNSSDIRPGFQTLCYTITAMAPNCPSPRKLINFRTWRGFETLCYRNSNVYPALRSVKPLAKFKINLRECERGEWTERKGMS